MSTNGDRPPRMPGREPPRPLPKRFYASVTVEPAAFNPAGLPSQTMAPDPGRACFHVLLDGKPVRTPKQRLLELPSRALADAVAAEWDAQHLLIDPSVMPLTRLVNTVVDGVQRRESEIRQDIVRFLGSDLLCYRAEAPAALVERQAAAWDPMLAWARSCLDIDLEPSLGIMPRRQGGEALGNAARAVAELDAFRLAALHVMVTLTGSAVLGLAVLRGRLSADAAWSAAHVDEDWQISQWGEDGEATRRRTQRWRDMQAASKLLALLPPLPALTGRGLG